ncbi:hypothetical protein BGZ98_006472 [Dissophora globulifera]|nr:hypothetical protein BGZ98_006472 [Dissophora globulifera]
MIHESVANEMQRCLDLERQNTALYQEIDMKKHAIQDLQNRLQVQSATADAVVNEATAIIRNEAVNAQLQLQLQLQRERTALLELLEIYQGSSIISDYIDRFTEQLTKVVDLPEKHKATLLYRGLNEDIKLLMINLPVVGFDSTCHQLLQIEDGMLNAKRKVKDNVSSKTISSTSSSYNNKGKSTSGRSNGSEKKDPTVCTKCHLKYHRAKYCHTDTSKKCERCGLFGHDTDSCHRKASNTHAAIKK